MIVFLRLNLHRAIIFHLSFCIYRDPIFRPSSNHYTVLMSKRKQPYSPSKCLRINISGLDLHGKRHCEVEKILKRLKRYTPV